MKNRIVCLLLLGCVLCLCACGGQAPAPTSSPDPAALEELDALFSRIRETVTVATAGSSLRCAAAAAAMLDWAEDAAVTDEQISAALAPWLSPLDDGVSVSFSEQLAAVGQMCRLLMESPEAEGLLSDAGCGDCGYPWSPEAIALVERILALAGLEQGISGN